MRKYYIVMSIIALVLVLIISYVMIAHYESLSTLTFVLNACVLLALVFFLFYRSKAKNKK